MNRPKPFVRKDGATIRARSQRITPRERDGIERDLKAGEDPADIASRRGLSETTVRKLKGLMRI